MYARVQWFPLSVQDSKFLSQAHQQTKVAYMSRCISWFSVDYINYYSLP